MAAVLRTLDPGDWRLWRAVRLRALADAPDAFGSTLVREQAHTEADWRDFLADGLSVVVLDTDSPVACGAVFEKAPGRAAIIAMWTDPAHRAQGHARRVLDALTDWAGARELTVELGVNRLNGGAQAAYTSYGFQPTGRCHPLRDGSDQVCDVWELSRG
ncbi:MAG: GNAT family N-acetyltransferase [Marmoricola sp.]